MPSGSRGLGDEGVCTEHCTCNLCHNGHNERERRSLRPEGPGPKAFRSNVHDACFPKCFGRPKTLSSMTAKLIPTSSWWTTASRAGQAGRTMTFSSSSSSPFTWLTRPKLARSLAQKLDRLLGGSQEDLLLPTFMTHMCGPVILGT
jgi:hypothetical protein